MPATTYTVSGEGFESVTRSNKQAAIKIADEQAKALKVELSVTTGAGTVVHVAKVRKAQVRTKAFTRVDTRDFAKLLGEGVSLPSGFEVAYLRPRSTVGLIREITEDGVNYLVFDFATGANTEVATTREGGAIMRQVHKGELTLAL